MQAAKFPANDKIRIKSGAFKTIQKLSFRSEAVKPQIETSNRKTFDLAMVALFPRKWQK